MPLAPDQVQLVRASGSLLLGPGTPYTVLPGWDPWSRSNRDPQTVPRPYAHGSLVGSEWVDEAVVLIPVSVHREQASRSDWMAAHQQLAAAFTGVGSSGEMAELYFEWGGIEYVMFGRPRQVRVTADNVAVGKSVEQCAFVAPDPRIYSAEVSSVSTRLTRHTDGMIIPTTVPFGVRTVRVSGAVALSHTGTADAPVTVRIDGPVENPVIVLQRPDGSVQQTRVAVTLDAGQFLLIDSTRRSALLDGAPAANFRGASTWGWDAYPLQPGLSEFRFWAASYEPGARATVSYRSAWW